MVHLHKPVRHRFTAFCDTSYQQMKRIICGRMHLGTADLLPVAKETSPVVQQGWAPRAWPGHVPAGQYLGSASANVGLIDFHTGKEVPRETPGTSMLVGSPGVLPFVEMHLQGIAKKRS